MKTRLYFSFGMTKTGSTLAFRLTQRFYQRNGYEQPLAPGALLGEDRVNNYVILPTADQLDGLVRFAADNDTCIVLKTHSAPTPEMADLVRQGQAHAHAVFRDPREMALSMLDHGARNRALIAENHEDGDRAFTEFFSLSDACEGIERQLPFLEDWLKLPGVFPAYYDDFAWTHEPFIKRLRRQTGLTERSVKGVLASFNGQKRSQFNKAQPERWREDMTAEDSAEFRRRFRPVYTRLIRWRRWPLTPFLRRSQSICQ